MTYKGTLLQDSDVGVDLGGGGTLTLVGTINQTGAGDLEIDGSSVYTTLNIPAGSIYKLAGDSSIADGSGAGGVINNAGTLERTVGTNVSTISTLLNNTGTMAVNTGTLDVTGAVSQVTGTTLEAGTWSVAGSPTVQSTLTFASPTNLSTIGLGATVTLSGPNSAFTNLANISSNTGSFILAGSQGFATAGSFTNSGTLTLGAGDTLHVAGNYTQTSGATLGATIDGTVASGAFGQINATGSATLAGTLNVTVPTSFTPTAGSSYAILTYASHSGTFSTTTVSPLPGGLTLTPAYNARNFTLSVTDPPRTAAVVAALPQSGEASDGTDVVGPPSVAAPASDAIPSASEDSAVSSTSATVALSHSPSNRAQARRLVVVGNHPGHSRPFHTTAPGRRTAAGHPASRAALPTVPNPER
jgi:hypothetical protein